jgi:hypothetical protein
MKPLLKIAFLSIACFSCFCINNAAGSEDVIPGSQKIDRENQSSILLFLQESRKQTISENLKRNISGKTMRDMAY